MHVIDKGLKNHNIEMYETIKKKVTQYEQNSTEKILKCIVNIRRVAKYC